MESANLAFGNTTVAVLSGMDGTVVTKRWGMTMAKNKGIYRIFRTKEELQYHDEEIRHFTRVFTLDHVTVALGCMGFRESKFKEFDCVLTEVFQEYMADYSADLQDDKAM